MDKKETFDYKEICETALKLSIRINDIDSLKASNRDKMRRIRTSNIEFGKEKIALQRQLQELLMTIR